MRMSSRFIMSGGCESNEPCNKLSPNGHQVGSNPKSELNGGISDAQGEGCSLVHGPILFSCL